MDRDRYFGYIYGKGGKHAGAKQLNGTRAMEAFVRQNLDDAPRMIVTDVLDRCVLESKDGEVIFPRPDQETRLKPMLRVLSVEPHESPQEMTIPNTLEAMQTLVGGLIEFVPLDDDPDILLVCNEEGKVTGLEGNRRVGDDIIAGSFFVCADGGENFKSLSDEQLAEYSDRFAADETFTPQDMEEAFKFEFYPL
ncbi:MAG: DUF3846 domain-containing protein [Oscillospiraceae bacterium]